jgi:hypothetical protein
MLLSAARDILDEFATFLTRTSLTIAIQHGYS